MAQFDLNRAGDTPIATLKLNEITPKNWHRFPGPIAPSVPVYVPAVAFSGGVANQGANAGNDGETGTATSTNPSRGQTWNTQAEKAVAIGTTMAVDVTRSYGTNARGNIEPREPYPATLDTAEVPAAFRESNYTSPGGP